MALMVCYGCKERSAECHASCQKYLAEFAENRERNARVQTALEENESYWSVRYRGTPRMKGGRAKIGAIARSYCRPR